LLVLFHRLLSSLDLFFFVFAHHHLVLVFVLLRSSLRVFEVVEIPGRDKSTVLKEKQKNTHQPTDGF
jgi:hypothetical protein